MLKITEEEKYLKVSVNTTARSGYKTTFMIYQNIEY